ncbi:MAG TPA: 4Fe-4S binding protein, partial [Anaerolineales bacterium]|nr:4Fe-4S binding protein [Anaerolineales bacterium]
REHDPETSVHVFMMDMRAFSKGYEAYYQRAREQYGIQYTRCRISALREQPESQNLIVRYLPENVGAKHTFPEPQAVSPRRTGAPTPDEVLGASPLHLAEDSFDLVVLSVGMEISEPVRRLGRDLGVELDDYGFCHTALFQPLETSRPGIYAAGPFREPKDIPETVTEASAAAARAAGQLAAARHSLTRVAEYPPELDQSQEEPRVGVFVCHCGTNIGGYLDVPGTATYASGLPGVVHAEHNLYTCSQDSIAHITQQVRDLGLNRVVVASCTPRTHAPLFQDSLRAAGVNPALFEMANIRNQCSWVHSHDREAATAKAKALVRMAVARSRTLEPLHTTEVPLTPVALVLGGGLAGMTASLELARGGFDVHLVEREPELGGHLRRLYSNPFGPDPQELLADLLQRLASEPRIRVYTGHRLLRTEGFVGNFTTTLQAADGATVEVRHGAAVVATGAEEYRGSDYGYGKTPRLVTGQEMEALLAFADGRLEHLDGRAAEAWEAIGRRLPEAVTFLLCVGPSDRYCSRICCSVALKQALALKRLRPALRVTVLFQDLRAYGFKEAWYTQARREGVVFVRYDPAARPEVSPADDGVMVRVAEPAFGDTLELRSDLLVLSMPLVPRADAREVASTLKVPLDADGFFLEAHMKLRPVDVATEGFFLAGLAHYPKTIEETTIQAQAAAARAARLLSRPALTVGGSVAQVDPAKCVGCLTCVRLCPFDVPQIVATASGVGAIQGAAYIEPTVCRGCGSCVAECPAKAIRLAHFADEQIVVKIESLMEETEVTHA